ncbi:MAG: hypothetical protein GF393_08690 [Armatimonadia bacterium]|nr:hypothetical protein [Armatimonadia bacterium]
MTRRRLPKDEKRDAIAYWRTVYEVSNGRMREIALGALQRLGAEPRPRDPLQDWANEREGNNT